MKKMMGETARFQPDKHSADSPEDKAPETDAEKLIQIAEEDISFMQGQLEQLKKELELSQIPETEQQIKKQMQSIETQLERRIFDLKGYKDKTE